MATSLLIYHLLFYQVMDEHNIVRKQHNLEFFNLDEQLMREADDHAQWMARNESMTHSTVRSGGENVAKGVIRPEAVTTLWMDSPGHRRNILDRRFTRIGAAVYKSKSGNYYWCVRFR